MVEGAAAGPERLSTNDGEVMVSSNEREPDETHPDVRYVVHVDPSVQARGVDVSDLEVDRLPDLEGVPRFLVSAEELEQLRGRGVVVDVAEEMPTQALDPDLVYGDAEAMADLERRLEGIEREDGS